MTNSTTSRGTSGIAWPGLLVLLGSLCAYWLSQNELTTSRPEAPGEHQVPDPVGADALGATYSRMWEDPISTTYEHWKKNEPEGRHDPAGSAVSDDRPGQTAESQQDDVKKLFTKLVDEYEGSKTLCLPILVKGGPHAEDKETRLRTRYAVVTALVHAGYRLSFPDRLSYAEVTTRVLALQEGEQWTTETFVIPVKLYRLQKRANDANSAVAEGRQVAANEPDGGEDSAKAAEGTEESDDSGRTESDEEPQGDAEPQGDEELQGDEEPQGDGEPDAGETPETRGGQTAAEQQILVLWINESQLGKMPLLSLNRITDAMFGGVTNRNKLEFRIIGPSSSDGLVKIYNELSWFYESDEQPKESKKHEKLKAVWQAAWDENCDSPLFRSRSAEIPILSPRATAAVSVKFKDKISQESEVRTIPRFRIIRTIGNDHLLVFHALKQELDTRGAWPDAGKKQVMILLTEHDTSYGRRIVGEFEALFGDSDNPDEPPPQIPLRVLKYLRGADGQTAGETVKRNAPKSAKSNPGGDLYFLPNNETTTRLPQGESQYDYLRRLKTDLRELEEKQRITAIGVVGSDVYDKLLVLRALRPHFPDTIFFTTDLDAIYEHPDELRHTRNLVIASHYGLRLNSDFHDKCNAGLVSNVGMLPFRDSYQTAEHLTTRIAVGDAGIRDALRLIVSSGSGSGCVLDLADKLWNTKHDQFSHTSHADEDMLVGELSPLITIVGNTGFRQLKIPSPGSADDPPDSHDDSAGQAAQQQHADADDAGENNEVRSSSLHPEPSGSSRSLRAPLTVLLMVLGVAGYLIWDHRETISEILSDRARKGSPVPPDIKQLQAGFLNAILPVTLLLLLWAVGTGMFGLEQILLDGTSVMPRVFAQILIGLSAALTLVQFSRHVCAMWHRWRPSSHLRLQESGLLDRILSEESLPRLRARVAWNVCMLACCLFASVAVVLYSPQLVPMLLGIAIAGLFAGVIRMKFTSRASLTPGELKQRIFTLFQPDSSQTFVRAFGLVIGVLTILMIGSVIASYLTGTVNTVSGWRPYFMSRGGWTTWILDFSSMTFAHAMICLLFSAILYGHEWSREFTRYLRDTIREFDPESRPEPDDQVDSLILIGEATVVTTKYTPWLLVYILGLLLAYHPVVSPVPIPTGVLIVLSLAIGILVASTLYVRWVTHRHRAEVLEDLRGRLFNRRRENANQELRKSKAAEARRAKSIRAIMSR